MEKKKHGFSLPKQVLFFGVALMLVGLNHGSRLNQASMIQAYRRAKSQRGNAIHTIEWESSDLIGRGSSSQVGNMEFDLIANGLPGQPIGMKFKQYAGYVTVDESHGRRLFYYLAEAEEEPSSKPLVLWLNGGPGCSSLGIGAMNEIGPFGVHPDHETLYHRQDAWNKVANMLFVESPAGVGFSYSNTTSDYYNSGDKRTALDSYVFLVNWFQRFPHYKDRDFYIAGESYAGFYIPELADFIIQNNKPQETSSHIKLKGIMIGNGIINDVTDEKGRYDYLWSHALISDESHKGIMDNCWKEDSNAKDTNANCPNFLSQAIKEVGDIDFSDIYAPKCTNSKREELGFDPCSEDYVYTYLNLPRVQNALHANTTGLPYPWDFCSILSWKDRASTMFPIYRRLISAGLHILLYSGDTDAVVSVTGTRYSVNALNLSIMRPWHPWTDDNREVGGYLVVYNGLTLATVRGAGHEVPRYQPGRALALFRSFLAWDY